jgi:hypothetical protein
VPVPAKRRDLDEDSPAVAATLSVLRSRAVTLAPGTVIGAGVYVSTGRLWPALLLACLVGRPTKAIQNVVAEWIELLAPPRRWRRPRGRGS